MRSLGGLVAGVLVGASSAGATVVLHSSWWWLALGLATALTLLRWLPSAARVGFALGWVLVVARASLVRPEGDYLVSSDAQGWTLIGATLVLVVATLVHAALRAGRTGDHGVRGTSS